MTSRLSADAVQSWLEGLPVPRRDALARAYLRRLARAGLHRFGPDSDRRREIPATLTPVSLDEAEHAELRSRAHHLLQAAVKAARHALRAPPGSEARAIFADLQPIEIAAPARDPECLGQVATARLDLFVSPRGEARVLEINATIPAMQGYSDMLSEAWVRTLGEARGLPEPRIRTLVRRAASNSQDLLDGLLAQYEALGGRASRPSILIVSREGDAQRSELDHYVEVFEGAGHRALHVHSGELELDPAGQVRARGRRFELIYRHVFARRSRPGSALAQLLVDPGPNILLNPVLSPLEVKGLLAHLHASIDEPRRADAYGLGPEEREAVAELVPWTRVLSNAPSTLPDHSRTPDLAEWVRTHPEALVLKPGWGYGGHGVLIGSDHAHAAGYERTRLTFGEPLGWAAGVSRALGEPRSWIVQERVPSAAQRHLLLETADGSGHRARWQDLYTDLSVYSHTGAGAPPRGGASRVSADPVVNILGGGGMAPQIPRAVIEELLPRQERSAGIGATAHGGSRDSALPRRAGTPMG